MKELKKLVIVLLYILTISSLYPQDSQVLEFNNRPVRDVLAVMAELSGKSIIADSTISGNCSFYFSTTDMDEALDLFLKSQNLYISEWKGIFRVSRISSSFTDGLLKLECRGVDIQLVIDNLIELTGITILHDSLPRDFLTLNIQQLNLVDTLEIILKRYRDYTLESSDNYYYIKKEVVVQNTENSINQVMSNGITISEDGLISINISKIRFTQVIREFFSKTGREYFVQGRNDNVLEFLNFKDKTFDAMLDIILQAGSCDYSYSEGIYYIFDVNKNEVQNRHQQTHIIKLENIHVKELLKVLPGIYMSNNVLKFHDPSNSVIVSGTTIKTEPIIRFIKRVDQNPNKTPRWIKPDFIDAELLQSILLSRYSQEMIVKIDKESFIILLDDEEFQAVMELISEVDVAPESHLITLKYIKAETLLKNLPKTISEELITGTPNPSQLSFYGTTPAYNNLMIELEKIDKPVPQIKYKVLVIQTTLGDDFNVGLNMNAHSEGAGEITLPDGEWNSFAGSLGALLGLNFNVLSAFGPLFSFELNASLKDNRSKILVDTTLQALSGKKVSFRNTTTSRIYQKTVDAEGNEESTGATQEISWGIILDIEGWTSGDGMVTVNVDATLSDETTVSGQTSGIPSTSEKVVNTEVRTREGEPVVIGGLISSKKELSYEKTPLLGDIPLLGALFRRQVETETQSEFTIYLLPYIEVEEEDINSRMARAYKEFF